ncbi:MAG: DNA-3-methyladenine glycosylase family protein [Hyphomicrobiales bacterium]
MGTVLLIDEAAALAHLQAADPVMARLIASIGSVRLREDGDDPFRSLARAIIYQQLSGTAAGTIYTRFLGLFDATKGAEHRRAADPGWSPLKEPFPRPDAVLALDDETMRSAGLSRQKTAALRSLAEHFASGELGAEAFAELPDEEVIERVTRVRGIGRWTAEMFLLFHLRRSDVLPVNDIGINRAIRRHYGLEAMPKPEEVLRIGAPWRPHASIACWYLWRSEDVKLPVGDPNDATQ